MPLIESNGNPRSKSERSSATQPRRPSVRWYAGITRRGRLRTKFLLSLLLVSVSLTCSTLLVVRHRVQLQVREQIREGLQNSVVTFQHVQEQRERSLERAAELVADLSTLKALMTSQDPLTIQEGSTRLWQESGSDLFALADRVGNLIAIHTAMTGFPMAKAQDFLTRSLDNGEPRDWWFSNGQLFQVFIRPIYAGDRANRTEWGVLILGYQINDQVAADVSHVASSQVAFRYGQTVVVSTLPPAQREELQRGRKPGASGYAASAVDIVLGQERFLEATTDLSPGANPDVSLIVLRSYDEATRFLSSLNRWLLGLGFTAILAGSMLVFLISDTFTRPLEDLVGGVHALEQGDYDYPLEARGNDEVSELTESFDRMRRSLQSTQEELL